MPIPRRNNFRLRKQHLLEARVGARSIRAEKRVEGSSNVEAHASTHRIGGTDLVSPEGIGAAPSSHGHLKNNYEATTAPSSTDDSDSGYSIGSIWVNVTDNKAYICLDKTVGAAVWTEITQDIETINFIIDGGGSPITTGIKGDRVVDFDCTILAVTMLGDQSTTIAVDIWKDTYANFPPTDADSITASAVPTITTNTHSQDTTITGWTTAISAGDILRFNVDANDNATRVTVALKVKRT